jgi:hypothetical protein
MFDVGGWRLASPAATAGGWMLEVFSMIRYLRHEDIDPAKWDACVERAANGLIYAYSFYLDYMSRNWDGLVLGDYEAVMPLTWRRKFGIYYLYQPAFVAHAGVFGNKLSEQIINEFIKAIPEKFRLVEINLNPGNTFNFKENLRKNYVLPLSDSYENIAGRYKENVRRNVKKAIAAGCIVKKDFGVEEVAEIARTQLKTVVEIREEDFSRFRDLYLYLHRQQRAITYGVFNRQDELLASCVYFFSHNRAYYILVGNHPNGKTLGASHYLIDRFIADHANSNLLLDFEGSDIRNLEFFYQGFGGSAEVYPALRVDRLPWYVVAFRASLVALTVVTELLAIFMAGSSLWDHGRSKKASKKS